MSGVTDDFQWLWIGSFPRNIKLNLKEFVQLLIQLLAQLLVLHSFYHILMTFPKTSVILLSMLMILLSTLSVLRHPICSNN